MGINTNTVEVRRTRKIAGLKLLANAVINKNDIVMGITASGYVKQGALATGAPAIGVAVTAADNTGGADGDKTVDVVQGDFQFANSATNTCTKIDVAKKATAYIEDTGTVGNVSTGASAAGPIVDVNANGVVVRIES